MYSDMIILLLRVMLLNLFVNQIPLPCALFVGFTIYHLKGHLSIAVDRLPLSHGRIYDTGKKSKLVFLPNLHESLIRFFYKLSFLVNELLFGKWLIFCYLVILLKTLIPGKPELQMKLYSSVLHSLNPLSSKVHRTILMLFNILKKYLGLLTLLGFSYSYNCRNLRYFLNLSIDSKPY